MLPTLDRLCELYQSPSQIELAEKFCVRLVMLKKSRQPSHR